MTADPIKVRELRENKGLTQEVLAAKACVSKRTIQRMEVGAPIALETLADVAAVLGVEPRDIRGSQLNLLLGSEGDEGAKKPMFPFDTGADIDLFPISSGRRLVEAIRRAYNAHIEYDIDPTPANVDLIKSAARILNRVWDNPYGLPEDRPVQFTDEDWIDAQVEAHRVIEELAAIGIAVYVANYPALVEQVLYDEIGHPYTKIYSKPIPKTNIFIVVSEVRTSRIKRSPPDYNDDIPF